MHNRDYKILGKGGFYHFYNRGNGKMNIFVDDPDRQLFLYRIRENLFPEQTRRAPSPGGYVRKALPSGAFSMLCYSLMPNHFHLLLRQNTDLPLSKFMLKVCCGYSKYFNQKHERVGSLLQDQYKYVKVESDAQLLWLSAYIHNNSKTAGLVPDLKDYPWSSYLDYVGQRQGTLCDQSLILEMFNNDRKAYEKFVSEAYEKIKEQKDFKHLFLDE